MRVRELFETKDPYLATPESMTPEQVAQLLESKCKSFVEAYRQVDSVIVRGIKEHRHEPPDFVSGLIRTDRRPLFMDEHYHHLISDAMEQMGYASRRNSLFCTTSMNIADSWGGPYILFVEDGFNGVVFEKVVNDYAFNDLYEKASDIFNQEGLSGDERLDLMKDYLESLEPFKFTSAAGLQNVIKQKYDDILITGKKYYGLSINNETMFTGKVFDLLGIKRVRNVFIARPIARPKRGIKRVRNVFIARPKRTTDAE